MSSSPPTAQLNALSLGGGGGGDSPNKTSSSSPSAAALSTTAPSLRPKRSQRFTVQTPERTNNNNNNNNQNYEPPVPSIPPAFNNNNSVGVGSELPERSFSVSSYDSSTASYGRPYSSSNSDENSDPDFDGPMISRPGTGFGPSLTTPNQQSHNYHSGGAPGAGAGGGGYFPPPQQQQQHQQPQVSREHITPSHVQSIQYHTTSSPSSNSALSGGGFSSISPSSTPASSIHGPKSLPGSLAGGGGKSPNGSARALPPGWMPSDGSSAGMPVAQPFNGTFQGDPNPYGQQVYTGVQGMPVPVPGGIGGQAGPEEEVIPTAIVVKNIPFSVKREQLLQIIEDLQIPAPYAFNYHFDGGIFRGLAFANFRTATETDQAVAALNGFDVQGRKLRVEYKKVLQAGEKERIEREKAIKRMRSVQLEKERERAIRGDTSAVGGAGSYIVQGGVGGAGGAGSGDDYEDFGRVLSTSSFGFGGQQQGGSSGWASGGSGRGAPPPPPASGFAAGGMGQIGGGGGGSPLDHFGGGGGASVTGSERSRIELDFNDPNTLEIYSRIRSFKDDNMRDELAFARSLTASQRRIVHMCAKKEGLEHRSVGQGDERYVVVFKGAGGPDAGGKSLRHVSSNVGLLTPESAQSTSGLRSKKSMPDMRGGSNTLGVPNGTTGSLGSRRSNTNLRQQYATVGRTPSGGAMGASPSRPDVQSLFPQTYYHHPAGVPVPPVPALPHFVAHAQENGGEDATVGSNGFLGGGVGGGAAGSAATVAVRQPKGPEADVGRNFAQRSAAITPRPPHSGGEDYDGPNVQTHQPLEF